MKRFLTTATIGVFAASAALCADTSVRYDTDTTSDRTLVAERGTDHSWVGYHANEVDFSFFGTGTVGERTLRRPSTRRIERNGRLGAGAGMSYFFHRNVGIEGYAYSESTHHDVVDNVGGDLIARFPILNSGVAPYIFGGGGRQFDPALQWTWDAGGGLEWRFLSHMGIFIDARYVWADNTKDYGLGRLGLKFGF
jgi:hypothetical protein